MTQTITVEIPRQLELLCSPLEITPGQILQGFINDLSLEVHGGNGSDERRMAVEYFLRVDYGAHCYDPDQITLKTWTTCVCNGGVMIRTCKKTTIYSKGYF